MSNGLQVMNKVISWMISPTNKAERAREVMHGATGLRDVAVWELSHLNVQRITNDEPHLQSNTAGCPISPIKSPLSNIEMELSNSKN